MRSISNNLINTVASLLIVIVLFACSGCKPTYTDVKLHKVICCDVGRSENGKMKIGFGLDVENPNNFNINVKGINAKVRINGIEVGAADPDEKFTLLKRSRNTYKLYVIADINKILASSIANLGALLGGGKKTMEAEIEGELKASAMGISKTIPVEGKYPISLK